MISLISNKQKMKAIAIILSLVFAHTLAAQGDEGVSIFHRLLILNSENELLVVKIKDSDFWVTPGVYQTKVQTIKASLDSISATYGIKTEAPVLNGMFLLKRDLNGKTSASLRNTYTAKVESADLTIPEGIEEVRWLPVGEAMALISFPHINAIIAQVMSHPGQVWGGTLLQYKVGEKMETKISEAFYLLSGKSD